MDFLKHIKNIRIIPQDISGITNGSVLSVTDNEIKVQLERVNESLKVGEKIEIFLPDSKCLVRFTTEIIDIHENIVCFSYPEQFKQIQRREYSRVDVNIPVNLTKIDEPDDVIESLSKNLSGGGIQVISSEKFEKGVLLEASFNILDNKSVKTILELLRIEENNSNNNEYFISGCFKEISNSDRVAIIHLCFKRKLELKYKGIKDS